MDTVTRPGDRLLTDCVRSALARHGLVDWRVEARGEWCVAEPFGGGGPVQGWKLHISATPLSAPVVLARVADILARRHCPFKFAADLDSVRELGAAHTPRGGGGKFITAYPDVDGERWRGLAAELDEATRGLPGPGILSDRPVRPGSLVHYRFGVFSGIEAMSVDGTFEAMLEAPDGTLVLDRREAWFNTPEWAPPDPLTTPEKSATAGAGGPVLLNNRYLVTGAVRHSFTGGVFRATDQSDGNAVIVKQARRHSGADLSGADARAALRHEADLLLRFNGSGLTPGFVETFAQQGDLFLVEKAIAGHNLRLWIARNVRADEADWGPPPALVARIARGLCDVVERMHGDGFVLRDLNPGNVMVDARARVRLIDLELVAVPGEPVVRAYTPAYGAPEQVDAEWLAPAPPTTADLYGLGATLFHLATGIDPQLPEDVPASREPTERIALWLERLAEGNATAAALAPTITALMDPDPARRPDIPAVRATLSTLDDSASAPTRRPLPQELPVDGIVGHLLATMDLDHLERLWPQDGFAARTDPLNVQHGAAGVLAALRLVHPRDAVLRESLRDIAAWIGARVDGDGPVLPGVHFGRAGTAWALLDTALDLGAPELADTAVALAKRLPSDADNPDVAHGLAGAGLTWLHFAAATGDDDFTRRAVAVAEILAERAVHDGGLLIWPVPRTSPSLFAGTAHYGFAHGTAGIGAFLLAAHRVTGRTDFGELAEEAGRALGKLARVDDGAARWPDESGGPIKNHWCAGSSGVGTFLAQLWLTTGDPRTRDLAEAAACTVRRARRHAGTSQCHGLAGDGEFLLDLAAATGDGRYREWAGEIAAALATRTVVRHGRLLVPDETGATVRADYGTGMAGVLAFLTRLRNGGRRLWLPEAFTGDR